MCFSSTCAVDGCDEARWCDENECPLHAPEGTYPPHLIERWQAARQA